MPTAETARLIASLELQDKNFTRGLTKIDKGITRVDKKLGAFSGALNRNLGRAVDTVIAKGVDALAGTIQDASNLNEEITKSQAVFGKSSAAINEWGDTTAGALGIAKVDALGAAGAFGNMFKTVGLTDATSADFSKTMVELAADMASFNNEDPTTMLDKLRSGLSGEAEPLRRYGVLLSEAAVKEQAYAMGLAKKGKKLTEAQKVQARYALILKQTAVQQGDVEKTGGNLAGQQRKLNALMKDASSTLGTSLLPAVTDVTAAFVDLLKDPETQKGIKAFGKELGEGAKSLVSALKQVDWKAFKDALGTAAGFAKDIVTAFLGMPSWVQAAVISGWGLNKLTGGAVSGLIGNLASGLIKGVLGMNAGVVNITAGTVTGGGVGGAAGAAGGASKLTNAVRILGAVSIAGASLIALAEVFRGFQTTVTESQQDLLEKVNQTSEQGFKETIANLEATNAGIKNMNPLESVLAGVFGGSEIVKNFQMATERIDAAFQAGELSRDEMITAIGALSKTLETNPEISLPGTESLLKQLIAAVNKKPIGPDRPEKRPPVSGVGDRPSPGNPGLFRKNLDKIGFDKWVTKAQDIKNAVTTTGADQKAELGNIKNATATLDSNTKTGLSNVKNATNTQGTLQAGRDAVNTTVTAVGALNTASATRNVSPPIVGALNVGFAGLSATIWAARPVIPATTVVQNYTVSQRGGSTSDSRTRSGQ